MPRTAKTYDAALKQPPEILLFPTPDGTTLRLPIWQDLGPDGTNLVKCDLCDQFVVCFNNHSTGPLNNHRGSQICNKNKAKRDAASTASASRKLDCVPEGSTMGNDEVNAELAGPSLPAPDTVSQTPAAVFKVPQGIPSHPRRDSFSGHSSLPPSSPPQYLTSIRGSTFNIWMPQSHSSNLGDEDFLSNENLCPGQQIEWPGSVVWDTYTFHRHSKESPGWTPLSVDPPKHIYLQADTCRVYRTYEEVHSQRACTECFSLLRSRQLADDMERALKDPRPHTPWKYLNALQLQSLIIKARERAAQYRLQILAANRRIACLEKNVSDWHRIVMLISQNHVPAVSRILSIALRNGASPQALAAKLQLAIDGTYRPTSGWTDREYAVAFLVKAFGGPRLLYVLQKAEGYPSLSTLRRRKPIPELAISLGSPSLSEFNDNIAAFLDPSRRTLLINRLVGLAINIDSLAIEEAIRLDFKRTSFLGVCREHADRVKLSVESPQDIFDLAKSLFERKDCHFGKDATVLGLAPLTAVDNYHVTPLVLLASCKSEKGDSLAKWVLRFIQAYRAHPHGEAVHGPIVTIATDGESSFRRLRFLIGVTDVLDANTPLGKVLYRLPGLNKATGSNGLLSTCDPKHVVKRFATMLRSPKGIQADGIHVTSKDTLGALQLLEGMTREKALLLLNPADKQNVPKAVHLLQNLASLQSLSDPVYKHAGQQERVRGVIFIGQVLNYFLQPFIDVRLSLSEQIRHLSTYTHLISALFWKHGLSFMTSALLADSQAIVKHILFTTARLQLIDRSMPYYILFEGTDRLENLFSHVRTQDHARNFEVQQLSWKLSIAAEIDSIFQRHPDLDRGHIRRNLVNARGVDHINPKSWIGDVRVGKVNLEREYLEGRRVATTVLKAYFMRDENWEQLFTSKFRDPGIDHLRPGGDYVGYGGRNNSDSNDDDLVDVDDIDDDESASPAASTDPTAPATNPNPIPVPEPTTNAPPPTHLGDDDDVHSKDLLNPPSQKSDKHYFIMDDDSRVYIPTAIHGLLDADRDRRALVTTRGLRAMGVTIEKALRRNNFNLNSSGDDLDKADSIVKIGDLGGILTRVNGLICLAVAEVFELPQGASRSLLDGVTIDDLDLPGPKSVTIGVQILRLVANSDKLTPNLAWWWSQSYIQLSDSDGGPTQERHYTARIPGFRFFPLSPGIDYSSGDNPRPIWILQHVDLEKALTSAWASLEPESNDISARILQLPQISGPDSIHFPHHLLEDSDAQLLYILPESLPQSLVSPTVKLHGADERACYLCGDEYKISDMRNHVGTHILRAYRDVEDTTLAPDVEVGPNPCGWCGRSDSGCVVEVVESETSAPKIFSNCEYHYSGMIYSRAAISTISTPCTNVPITCCLCAESLSPDARKNKSIWKYSFMMHMAERHLDENGKLMWIPVEMWVVTHISKLEELKIGIPEEKTEAWREANHVPDSDGISLVLGILHEEEPVDEPAADDEESRARKRTGSIASSQWSRAAPAKKRQQIGG